MSTPGASPRATPPGSGRAPRYEPGKGGARADECDVQTARRPARRAAAHALPGQRRDLLGDAAHPGDPVVDARREAPADAGADRGDPRGVPPRPRRLDPGTWLLGRPACLHGDFGRSFVYKTDVSSLIGPRFGITLLLVLLHTGVLIIVFGSGRASSPRRADASWTGRCSIATSLGVALPTFVVAILLIWVFGRDPRLVPGVRRRATVSSTACTTSPCRAISLAVLYIAYISRITRGAFVAQLLLRARRHGDRPRHPAWSRSSASTSSSTRHRRSSRSPARRSPGCSPRRRSRRRRSASAGSGRC